MQGFSYNNQNMMMGGIPAPFQQPNYLAYAQQQLGYRETVFVTPEQQKAQLLATSIGVFLGVVMLPVSIFDIVAVAKAGQNMQGIAANCGDAFYTFIVANMALNFVFCIVLLMTAVYINNLDANALQERKQNPSNNVAITLGCMSGVYAIFAIAALIIVAIGMSSNACSDAIALVSFGQPLLGIVGYINVAIDFFVLIATSGMACKFYVSTTQYKRVGMHEITPPPRQRPHYFNQPEPRQPSHFFNQPDSSHHTNDLEHYERPPKAAAPTPAALPKAAPPMPAKAPSRRSSSASHSGGGPAEEHENPG